TVGLRLAGNFRLPYCAAGIGEFWRRWHVSLSSWLRDYLYVPLGGNRGGAWQTYRNLMLTMLLGGLWHGAAVNFVAWGGYHGLLLALERAGRLPPALSRPAWTPVGVAATFLAVCVGWALFRSQSFGDTVTILAPLACPTAGLSLPPTRLAGALLCLAAMFAGHLVPALVDLG